MSDWQKQFKSCICWFAVIGTVSNGELKEHWKLYPDYFEKLSSLKLDTSEIIFLIYILVLILDFLTIKLTNIYRKEKVVKLKLNHNSTLHKVGSDMIMTFHHPPTSTHHHTISMSALSQQLLSDFDHILPISVLVG